jgi:hypothetical protein
MNLTANGTEQLIVLSGVKTVKKSISQLPLMEQKTFEVNFPGMTKIAIHVQQVPKEILM